MIRSSVATTLCALAIASSMSAQITYTDVAGETGLDHITHIGPPPASLPNEPVVQENLGVGCAVGDYDDDGDLDVYLLQGEGFPNRLYRNDLETGTVGFTDVTESVGAPVGDLGAGRLAHFADLDGDGDLDLLVLNDRDEDWTMAPSKIFENNGDGTFTDAGPNTGFAPGGLALCGCAVADYDQDGLLDIFVSAWTHHVGLPSPFHAWYGQNYLYRNLGGMRFEDVTVVSGLAPDGFSFDCFTPIFHDLDDDHFPDLFIAVDHAIELMYRNEGGSFTRENFSGLTHTGNDMGVAVADYDNDGDLDLYLTNITDTACGMFGMTQHNVLYERTETEEGHPFYRDVAMNHGVHDTAWGWGTVFVDADNDTDLDLAAVNGFDRFVVARDPNGTCSLLDTPAVMFQNDGTGFFTRTTAGDFTTFGDDSRALVAFDFDRDGDQDLLVTNVEEPVRLYRNDTPRALGSGNWLGIKVRQAPGRNIHGLGVHVDVYTDDGVTRRQPILSAQSYLAGVPAEVHFGLDTSLWVNYVRVHWEDGTATTIRNVPGNQVLTIEQPIKFSNWDGNGVIEQLDALLYAWAWILQQPEADLDGNGEFEMHDVNLFLANWFEHQGPV